MACVLPALTRAEPLGARSPYWAGRNFEHSTVSDGDRKLIADRQDGACASLNLAADHGGNTDLVASVPGIADHLGESLVKLSAADTGTRSGPPKWSRKECPSGQEIA